MAWNPPPDIDPLDPQTWVRPVEIKNVINALTKCHVYRAEYAIPSSPNAIVMAMLQLPEDIPRNCPSYPRFFDVRANPRRDGRGKGGFAIQVTWPGTDLFDAFGDLERVDV